MPTELKRALLLSKLVRGEIKDNIEYGFVSDKATDTEIDALYDKYFAEVSVDSVSGQGVPSDLMHVDGIKKINELLKEHGDKTPVRIKELEKNGLVQELGTTNASGHINVSTCELFMEDIEYGLKTKGRFWQACMREFKNTDWVEELLGSGTHDEWLDIKELDYASLACWLARQSMRGDASVKRLISWEKYRVKNASFSDKLELNGTTFHRRAYLARVGVHHMLYEKYINRTSVNREFRPQHTHDYIPTAPMLCLKESYVTKVRGMKHMELVVPVFTCSATVAKDFRGGYIEFARVDGLAERFDYTEHYKKLYDGKTVLALYLCLPVTMQEALVLCGVVEDVYIASPINNREYTYYDEYKAKELVPVFERALSEGDALIKIIRSLMDCNMKDLWGGVK